MAMYLICKKMHEISDVKVLLTGEFFDELFGYKYTDFAPNAEELQKESEGECESFICTMYFVQTVVSAQIL